MADLKITRDDVKPIILSEEAILDDLNPEQKRAVLTTKGPLLILAGAGSGKTRVITYRIAWLIRHLQVHPARILAITFTNKAANEMKERVLQLIGLQGRGSWIGTFHAMMLRILRRHGELVGYRSSFSIFDTADQRRVMADALKALGISERSVTPREALSRISRYKNDGLSPDEVEKRGAAGVWYDAQWAQVYRHYQQMLREKNAVDFDDILLETLYLFQKHPEVLQMYQRQFHYILVDEYQDTNIVQYELVKCLSAKHRNLCVVGDDDQSIYSFRGANIRNILDFEKDFPECTIIRLEQNYRSTKTILAAANQVIAENTGRRKKTLWTSHEEGVPVLMYRASDHMDEARFVAQDIARRLRLQECDDKEADIAVLYRVNALSRNIETALREIGIEYRVYGGTRFYDRAEIKDVIAYMTLVASPEDELAFRRVINQPRRGIGAVSLERLAAFAGQNGLSLLEAARISDQDISLSRVAGRLKIFVTLIDELGVALDRDDITFAEWISKVEEDSGLVAFYEEAMARHDLEAASRLENLRELVSDAIEFEAFILSEPEETIFIEEDELTTLGQDNESTSERTLRNILMRFLERAALYSDQDKDSESPKVSLMTIHSAKGLEFDTVYIAGAEEGIFPNMLAEQEPDGIEEERRLAYVAVTRARKQLIVTSAVSRLLYGHTQYNPFSRFMLDISEELTDKRGLFEEETDEDSFGIGFGWHFAKGAPYGAGLKSSRSRSEDDEDMPYHAVTQSFFSTPKATPKRQGLDYSTLNTGDIVRHVTFGEGEILKITQTGDDAILTIDFNGTVKRYMASQSTLSKV
ncbi:MAG: UvrD-helicase domain-containing protein [Clostridiaceae bacterium]|nr:UvrD-helicase domain-containing protein [Clostridiaceae bacterium]